MTRDNSAEKGRGDNHGKVVGYEMSVACPYCEYLTATREAGSNSTLKCGGDFPDSDDHGCGEELKVIVCGA